MSESIKKIKSFKKFRVFKKETNSYAKDNEDFVVDKKNILYLITEIGALIINQENYIVEWETGKYDKNDIQIFENDRVNGAEYNGSYCIGIVTRIENEFALIPEERWSEGYNDMSNSKYFNVIGTTHDVQKATEKKDGNN